MGVKDSGEVIVLVVLVEVVVRIEVSVNLKGNRDSEAKGIYSSVSPKVTGDACKDEHEEGGGDE